MFLLISRLVHLSVFPKLLTEELIMGFIFWNILPIKYILTNSLFSCSFTFHTLSC